MPERTIIIGDIHGCFEELGELLSKLEFQVGRDRLISVGDLVNKGPRSVDVLRFFASSNSEAVLGNHELAFLEALASSTSLPSPWRKLREEMGDELDYWLRWLRSLPLYIEEEGFLVVHAGLEPGRHPSESSANLLTRIRTWDGRGDCLYREGDPPWFDFYKGEKLVVHGHWARLGLVQRHNTIGLDTGCVYGRSLSALVLPERQIESVQAKGIYCPIKPETEQLC